MSAVLDLARALQRAAFVDRPERYESLGRHFEPAPIYLWQANALASDPETMREVGAAILAVVAQTGHE